MTKLFYNKRKYRKRLNPKKNNYTYFVFMVLFFCIFMYSLFNIVIWFIDSPKTKNLIDELSKTKVTEVDRGTIIPSDEDKNNLYWSFIKMNLIDVNIDELKKKNSDTVGWIVVGGTNVNYPVVKTTDNEYYLDHSYLKEKNSAGWLFMDYRNSIDEMDQNTIIYGHNRKDQTMFGTLKNVTTSNWFNQSSNQIIKMSTESYNTLWQIFSIYIIPTTSDYLNLTVNEELLNTIMNRSIHTFNATPTTLDKILTLSTCHGNNEKLVVHAKLIKMESKS